MMQPAQSLQEDELIVNLELGELTRPMRCRKRREEDSVLAVRFELELLCARHEQRLAFEWVVHGN
eukprot:21663-Prymnesium_polylepis.1